MKWYHNIRNQVLSLFKIRTIGVRALVLQNESVLLVRHTYQPLWYTIGGAVERGETPLQAIVRELKEEVGAILDIKPKLFSVYYSYNEKRDDYVIFYLVSSGKFEKVYCPEIAEMKWFPLNQLPQNISPATSRRIDEYLGRVAVSDTW